MDWSAVAHCLAEQAGLSALLLDERLQLRLITPAAEVAFTRHDTGPGNWVERFVPQEAAVGARQLLDKAFSGALRRLQIPIRTPEGTGLAHMEARPVGRGDDAGLLLILQQIEPLARQAPASDYDYQVRGVSAGNLRLSALRSPGQEMRSVDAPCFEVLHGRASPCENCSLIGHGRGAGDEVVVETHAPGDYVVKSFTRTNDDCASVSVRTLSAGSLSAILQARLDQLATRAQLSNRERSVFAYLMDGRAVDDIASALAISPRTVKFHQANVLQKLGADSRSDLMRLVF
jgi:DNA-binding CsgD family transcriptional regulator